MVQEGLTDSSECIDFHRYSGSLRVSLSFVLSVPNQILTGYDSVIE